MASLGENIASLRREQGLTQAELGEKLCVSAQAVSKWERDLSQPDIATIRKIAALFDVTIESLLEDEEEYEEEEYEEDEEEYEDDEEYEEEEEEKPKIIGVCMTCGKMCEEGNALQVNGKLTCNDCHRRMIEKEKRIAAERKRKEEEERRRKEQEAMLMEQSRRYAAAKRLKTPLIWAGAITGVWLIPMIIFCVLFGTLLAVVLGILSLYVVFSVVYEFALSNSVLRWVCGKMFVKPNTYGRSRGCSCLMFLLFGFIYVVIALIIIACMVFVSVVAFPIDLHKCIGAAK